MPCDDTTAQEGVPEPTPKSNQPGTKPSGVSPSGSVGDLALCGERLRPNPTCDWGSCGEPATKARSWGDPAVYLAVCEACAESPE